MADRHLTGTVLYLYSLSRGLRLLVKPLEGSSMLHRCSDRRKGKIWRLSTFTGFLKALNALLQVGVTAYQLLSHLR